MEHVHFSTGTTEAFGDATGAKNSKFKRFLASGAVRFAGWWTIFAGALALNSVCPVCGSSACPIGIGTTGIIAGVIAAVKLWGGRLIKTSFSFFRRSGPEGPGIDKSSCAGGFACHDHAHHVSIQSRNTRGNN
ncbi:MAG: hypothetical protein MUD12_16410 [Spirochaetes bacterium]|jgi:hypothetical protein|nr:hypothetical protein [Spirochaetota bacterium]